MAAIDPPRPRALLALTAAALALPGLSASVAKASDDDGISIAFQHYAEGPRKLDGQTYRELNLKPLSADSLSLGYRETFNDRIKLKLNYEQDTWSGATPVTTVPRAAIADQITSGASKPSEYYTDAAHHPVAVNWDSYDGNTVQYVRDPGLVHVMASASPETRRQVDGKLGYEWDDAALNFGGGYSDEPDYKSYFGNVDGRLDLDEKRTTLDWAASYTLSNIAASLQANSAADWGAYLNRIVLKHGEPTLVASRRDVSASMGVTQILDRESLIDASIAFTHSGGYLSNPYKAAVLGFDDPDQYIDSTGLRFVAIKGVLDERPTSRNQWTFNTQFIRYFADWNASLHASYRFFHDNWGISAHTVDVAWYQPIGNGWMLVPDARYYTQTAASFYKPFYLFNQAFPILFPRNPELPPNIDFSQLSTHLFSSDERLSAFGTFTGQIAIDKDLRDGLSLEFGAEYFVHAGGLAAGRGEQSFADFQGYTLFASLNLGLAGRALPDELRDGGGGDGPSSSDGPPAGRSAPAGVDHPLVLASGDVALRIRHDYSLDGGPMLHGTHSLSGAELFAIDCDGQPCPRAASGEYAHRTTLDVSYGLTSAWTFVISPQFVDLHMDQRRLGSIFLGPGGGGSSEPTFHHSTGGIGDTRIGLVTRLWQDEGQEIDFGANVMVPTGSVDKHVNTTRDFASYALQPGSGTWDFSPNVTYTAQSGRFGWGAQASANVRLQSRNSSGYALGNEAKLTAWGSYQLFDWLSASLRGVVSDQGAIRGAFESHFTPTLTGYTLVNGIPVPTYEYDLTPQTIWGPDDLPGSYGGRFAELGLGLSAVVPSGSFQGQRLGVEWLAPVIQDVNGYQLKRTGTLAISWDIAL